MPILHRRSVRGGIITSLGHEAIIEKGHHMPETTSPETTYTPIIEKLSEGAGLPAGFTSWGFKVVRADLTTYLRPDGRFQWPHPTADGPAIVEDPNTRGTALCPSTEDGGVALALTFRGARDGGYGYGPILLCAFNDDDVVARGQTKVRVRRCAVVKVINPDDVFADVAGYDVSGADLSGARLDGASFAGANVSGVKFHGANLAGADFEGAKASGNTSFNRANLGAADFTGADLTGVTGHMANCRATRFAQAKFNGGSWIGSDFTGAAFDGADMSGANFSRCNLASVAGAPKNVAHMVLSNVVLAAGRDQVAAHPFKAVRVPRGRQDLYDAITGLGGLAAWEDSSAGSRGYSRY